MHVLIGVLTIIVPVEGIVLLDVGFLDVYTCILDHMYVVYP